MLRALVVLMLAGCLEDLSAPPVVPAPTTIRRSSAPDCSSLRPAMERIFSSYTGFQDQMAPILGAVTASCTEDAWSMSLVQCFIDASDDHHAQECANLLTKAQLESFQNRLMSAMPRSASPRPPSPPPPAPPDSP